MEAPKPMSASRQLRWLKPVLYVVGGLFALLVLAVILVPVLFREPLERKVRQTINEQVNARVNFARLDVSLLKRFPRVTVSLQDLSVVGLDIFAADTLVSTRSLDVSVNLWDVVFGDQLSVAFIGLEQPRLKLITLRDGRVNWDIAKPDTAAAPADTTSAEPFRLALQRYEITGGHVVYDDRSMPFYLRLEGLDHSGSGDFTADVLTLDTRSEIQRLTMVYDSVAYMSNIRVAGDATLRMDLVRSRYEFLDNRLVINDLPVQFAGFLALPDTSRITMDLKLDAPEASFKQLLSLVPGMYNQHFAKLTAQGEVAFGGRVYGTYHADSLPKFDVNLAVKEGQFQYEGLPEPVKSVNVQARAFNTWHTLDSVQVDISRFDILFGPNPFNATLQTKGLSPVWMNAIAQGTLNLESLTRIVPLAGYQLRGILKLKGAAKGMYGPNQMPVLRALVQLQDGFVKSDSLPAPLENLQVVLDANSKGDLASTLVHIPVLKGALGGQTFEGRMRFAELNDALYDIALKGRIDLAQLLSLFPQEGMTLRGQIAADVQASGRLSDVQNKRFAKVKADGAAEVANLYYASKEFPAGLSLASARMDFSPAAVTLTNAKGKAGRSDFAVEGALRNYLPFVLQESGVLEGTLTLRSRKLDLNQFLATDPNAAPPADTASIPMQAPQIPANVRFTFQSTVDTVLYDNLTLSQLGGIIQVADQAVRLVDCKFNTLGGSFVVNGGYRSTNPDRPHADFALSLQNVQIRQAWQTFSTVQALAPVAQYATGSFGTQLTMSTDLLPNLQPHLPSLTATGVVTLLETALRDVPLLSQLAGATRLPALAEPRIGNTTLNLRIADGRLHVAPFDVNLGQYKMTVEGSNGLDKSLAYNLAVDVPGGQVGQVASNLLNQVPGLNVQAPQTVTLLFGVGGTVTKPTLTPRGARLGGRAGSPAQSVTSAVTATVRDTLAKAREAAEARAREEAERLRQQAETKAREEADRIRQEAERVRQETEAKAREEARRLQEQARQQARTRLRGLLGRDSL